jgi:beta-lactamase class A
MANLKGSISLKVQVWNHLSKKVLLMILMAIVGIPLFLSLNTMDDPWKQAVIFVEKAEEKPQPLDLPMMVDSASIVPLRTLVDAQFQNQLESIIASNSKWANLVKNKKMCVGLVDMRDPEHVKFARVNGNYEMYAASLPKIAILLAATDAIDKGELEETPEIKSDMRLMIAKSNNAATTRMIDRIGLDKIAEVMQDPRYELYDEETGGGLWVGKRYASTGPRKGDPLKNISHAATVTQVCRYYYLLAFGQLVSYDRSKEMLAYMADPELHHKFVNTLDQVAPKAKVFRKSGSWRNYHSDSALIWGPTWRRYIIVALVEDADGEKIMRDLMREVDNTMKPKS